MLGIKNPQITTHGTCINSVKNKNKTKENKTTNYFIKFSFLFHVRGSPAEFNLLW